MYTLIIFISLLILILNPIPISYKLESSNPSHSFILTDFILETEKEYTITIDYTSNSKIELYYLYVEDNLPKEKIVGEIKNNQISFTTVSNAEYYYLKLTNLTKETNYTITSIKIDNISYPINYFLIPYQYLHQLKLLQYDKESITSRFTYYKDTINMLKDKGFILGHGLNTFAYLKKYYNIAYLETNPHSHILNLFLEIGLIGPIYFILLTILSIISIIKNKSNYHLLYSTIFLLCYTLTFFEGIFSNSYLNMLFNLSFLLTTNHYHKIPL